MENTDNRLIVLAIGGNSLIVDPAHQSVPDQYQSVYETCGTIAELLERGNRVVITHGNGPQVGFILRRAELAEHELHRVPLDSAVADTQGAIGYNIQLALYNRMRHFANRPPVATVVTQTLVDDADPAFQQPTKPIGSFMDEATAQKRAAEEGWNVVEDAGRGWRRVVASPKPIDIVELEVIRGLIEANYVVVAVGGGGIPVVRGDDDVLQGVEAVIDKDLASSLLARQIDADLLLISTAVEKVYLDFGTPEQRPVDRMTVAEAREYIGQGHFKPGSMLPKVEAVLAFLEAGGGEALITDPPNIMRAVAGETGTRVIP